MSAISPRHDSSNSRNWWSSLSSNSKSAKDSSYPSEKSSSRDKRSDGFKSIASAIGLSNKSKKLPSLAIQSPPPSFIHQPPPQGDPSYSPRKYANRPPSKSVSSTRSRVDSIEPKTPSDPRSSGSHRHSLLTLSDTDPFAARNVTALHSPLDPNRLSAYSNSSNPDYNTKKSHNEISFNRGSYASSSSNSNLYPEDVSIISAPSWITELPVHNLNHTLPKKKSSGNLGRGEHFSLETAWDDVIDPAGTMTKSHSSTTLTDKNRLSQPDTSRLPRPPMRARGMTDAGAVPQRSKFLQDDTTKVPKSPKTTPPTSFASPPNTTPTSPLSPRVVVRQPSIQRMGLPVTAPPSQKLPLPPVAHDITDDTVSPGSRSGSRHRDSAASTFSSLSLGRDIPNQHYIPRNKTRERTLMSQAEGAPVASTSSKTSSPTRTLKRATSQQSLKGSNGSTSSKAAPDIPFDKAPRKQRSFHHPRIPLPPMPMPLRHTSSFNKDNSNPIPSAEPSSHSGEGKRDSSASCTPVRKRLFSGSSLRRPSTSQASPSSTMIEDDVRSIFSLTMDAPERSLHRTSSRPTASYTAPHPPTTSFWDDPDPPSSPQPSQVDYTPQQIMSPAEMLKLEASVQESFQSSRARGLSVVSSSTIMSTSESEYAPSVTSLQPPPSVISHSSFGSPQILGRSQSMVGSSGQNTSNNKPKNRPSTSQGPSYPNSPMESVESFGPFSPSPSPPPGFVSLPPPPRPRRSTGPVVSSKSAPRTSVPGVPVLKPLSPPPRKQSLPPPTQRQMSRRSILKKPSFLHIDDDVPDQPSESQNLLKHEDSFLDFARDSLDTLRSDTDDRY